MRSRRASHGSAWPLNCGVSRPSNLNARANLMKRLAYIGSWIMLGCSWILFELALLSGYTSVTFGTPSAVNFVPSAVAFGIALFAFHAEEQRWISGLAAVLNGLIALAGCALVIFGINFSSGVGAFVAAGAFLVVFCGPALLNVVALLPTARGRNASEPVCSASG